MKLVGILNWYDEDPAWVAAAVASMANAGCDHILAMDGAYAAFPEAKAWSHPDQHAAILEVTRALGVGCTIHAPDTPWLGGEVEKRTFAFRLAETLTSEDDWLFLMDADEVILEAIGLRDALERADRLDVAEVRFCEPGSDLGFAVRCVFRALRGIELQGNHYTYVCGGVRLGMQPPMVPALDLSHIVVEHRTARRALARKQRQEAYYERRDRLGIEKPLVAA